MSPLFAAPVASKWSWRLRSGRCTWFVGNFASPREAHRYSKHQHAKAWLRNIRRSSHACKGPMVETPTQGYYRPHSAFSGPSHLGQSGDLWADRNISIAKKLGFQCSAEAPRAKATPAKPFLPYLWGFDFFRHMARDPGNSRGPKVSLDTLAHGAPLRCEASKGSWAIGFLDQNRWTLGAVCSISPSRRPGGTKNTESSSKLRGLYSGPCMVQERKGENLPPCQAFRCFVTCSEGFWIPKKRIPLKMAVFCHAGSI